MTRLPTNTDGLCTMADGLVTMSAMDFSKMVMEIKRLESRVTELQRDNNREMDWRRELEAELKLLRATETSDETV